MVRNKGLIAGLLLAQMIGLAACSANPEPAPERPSAPAPAIVPATPSAAPSPAAVQSIQPLSAQTVSGGGVAVTVKPLVLTPGQPAAFDIAMNSHSVEIVEDMLAATVLRDGAGRQFGAEAWDGSGPGGHHREGVIRFAPLPNELREVVVIVSGVANVPERAFRWLLPGATG